MILYSGRRSQRNALPTWKRILDWSLIMAMAPALIVLGIAIAIIIKCGSRGPVIFRQRRIGYKGQEFTCYKFRTMSVDMAPDIHQNHFQQLINSDSPMTKADIQINSHIIPFGSILRNTGLDELPQLINVLRGEMSIVGPRPCIPYEYEHYEQWQYQRFDAVPGLTGLWQVSGKNRTTFDQMVQLDIEYSKRLGVLLDLTIIFNTLPVIINQCIDMFAAKIRSKSQK